MKRILFLCILLLLTNIFAQNTTVQFSEAVNNFNAGYYAKAHKQFNSIIFINDFDKNLISTLYYYSAECLYHLQKYNGAATEFEAFLNKYPFSSFHDLVLYRLGSIYFKENSFIKSRDKLFSLIKNYPSSENTPSAYYLIGESYIRENKLREAEEFLQKAIEMDKSNKFIAQSIYSLAALYERNEDFHNAVKYYDKLLAFYKDSDLAPEAQFRIGICYFNLKEYDSVILELSDPIIKNLSRESQLEASYMLGNSYFRLREYENAVQIFKEIISEYPSDKESEKIEFALGWVNFQSGEYEKAYNVFNKLAKEASYATAVKSLFWSAECKRYLNESENAMAIYNLFLEKYPDDDLVAEVRFKMGLVYFNKDDIPVAERYLITSIDSDDEESRARAFTLLGEISLNKKDYRSAESYFSNASKSSNLTDDLKNRILFGLGVSQYFLNKMEEAAKNLSALNRADKRFEKAKVNYYLAESHFYNGNYEEALRHYARVGDSDEYISKMTLFGKAYSYFNLKDFANSTFYFNQFIKDYPVNENIITAKLRLAESNFGIKKFDSAVQIYDELFSKNSNKINSSFAFYNYAQALFKTGRSADAIQQLSQLQNKYPTSRYADDAQYLIGWIYFQQAEYREAITSYNKLFVDYESSPIRPIALYSVGDCYFNLSHYDSAIVYYNMVINNFPSTNYVYDAINGIQYCYLAMDEPEKAITTIDDFVSKNSNSNNSDKIFIKKAEIYYNQGNYSLAAINFQEFIAKYPNSKLVPNAYYWVGKCLVNLEQKDIAIENFRNVINNDIQSEFGLAAVVEMGTLYGEKNEFDSAIVLYQNAINELPSSPKVPELLFNKALVEIEKPDLTAAYETLNDLSKNYNESLFADKAKVELGLLELKRGGYENCELLFREVGNDRKDDIGAQAQYYYGVALFEQGKTDDAISALVRVRSVFPGYVEWYTKSLLKLGDCYIKINDKKNAREMFRAVLKKHNNNEFANEANEKLKSL
jgi:TolA-binding protein